MLLHCTLVQAPRTGADPVPLELTLDLRDDATGADVEEVVSRRFGTTRLSVAGVPLSGVGSAAKNLAQGAVLVDSSAALRRRENQARRRHAPDQPILSLVVHTGAGAGLVFPLRRGSYRIGRSGADIVIPDPHMSRNHVRLEVSETAVFLTDLGSANGTLVDGRSTRTTIVTTDSGIRCGNSFMTISPGYPALPPSQLEEAGTSVAEPLPVAALHQHSSRTTLLITAIAPLVIGVGLALMTGLWMFLAFSAMSGIAVLVPFLSGRRQRKEFRAALMSAVQHDQDRRRRAAPSIAELLSPGAPEPIQRQTPHACDGVWLRIGIGEQPANIRIEPPDSSVLPPAAGMLPVTLDPGTPMTTVSGPEALRAEFLRSVLLQLSRIPGAACSRVVVHGDADQLPLAARFLRNVHLSSALSRTRALMEEGKHGGSCRGVLFLAGPCGSASELIDHALSRTWQVLHLAPPGTEAAATHLELGEQASSYRVGKQACGVIPDLVSVEVFDRATRAGKTPLALDRLSAGLPARCSLEQLLPLSPPAISERWEAGRSGRGLQVPLGVGMNGIQGLDLEADGPHVLVAGTTGSGKSELLRGLCIALALSYPPDRINLLLVDFKGGSGLASLTGLPHSVGLLTDLSPHELDRFLLSLRSEIRHREHLLAAVGAQDLPGYRRVSPVASDPLPQLIVVIDEFRMLVEDAPAALNELLRIATVGRSLGMHLIMATQRPQGAITSDIRANVTTSIALRVQSVAESFDVINSRCAAGIGVGTPGRAFLSRGTESPSEFQAAALATAEPGTKPMASAQLAVEVMGQEAVDVSMVPATGGATPATATAPLVAAATSLWAQQGGTMPRRPVAARLPKELMYSRLRQEEIPLLTNLANEYEETHSGVPVVSLGILDKPEEQRLEPFRWSPSVHSHLALVTGAADVGNSTLLVLAVDQLLNHPTESHLYLLDGLASFGHFAATGRIGAKAGTHELRRGVRILERIHEEMTSRLSGPVGRPAPHLVLMVSGWGAWVSALRAGPLMWAEDLVQDITRDGAPANITVVLTGERELVTSRIFSYLPNKIYCPAGATEESRLAWPPMPRTAAVPGRAVAFGPAALGGPSVCQLYTSATGQPPDIGSPRHPEAPPFRVEPLPAFLGTEFLAKLAPLSDLPAGAVHSRKVKMTGKRSLILGLGGDEQSLITTPFPSGLVLAVLGRPGSGRSSVVRALAAVNPAVRWISPGPDEDPEAYWADVHASALKGVLDPTAACLIDDADQLPAMTNQLFLDLHARGHALVVTATVGPSLVQRVPVALAARSYGAGLLLAPRSLADGDVFGIRFDIEGAPPPGRAVLIANGQATALQLPHLPEGTTASAGSQADGRYNVG